MADLEKQQSQHIPSIANPTTQPYASSESTSLSILERIEKWEGRFGVEARGLQRVPIDGRIQTTTLSTLQVALTWCSINLGASNMLVGLLGPHVFALSFRDSALLCLFGNLLGTLGPAYISTYALSGNRTMVSGITDGRYAVLIQWKVILRFVFGWWPAKICAVLQLIGDLGYGLLSALITGQILSAVSKNGSMTVVVGVIVGAIITLIVCVVGMRVFHLYERYIAVANAFSHASLTCT
jgi:purine-cytosine permease-like protein